MNRACTLLMLLGPVGCTFGTLGGGKGPDVPDDGRDDTAAPAPDVSACSTVANLEIVPLDIWGRDLDATATLDHAPAPIADPTGGPGAVLVRLGDAPAELLARFDRADHEPLAVTVRYDGSGAASGFSVDAPGALATVGAVATSWGTRTIDGDPCPVYSVYVGLEHAWFAPSGRAPTRNDVTLYRDGEAYWDAVATDLDAATTRIDWATWWWESAFEFVRDGDHVHSTRSERAAGTAMALLDAHPSAERRILINRFWGENSDYTTYLNTDTELRDRAEAAGDDFEVVLQGNDTEVPVYGRYEGEPAAYDFGLRVLANARYADRAIATAPHAVAADLTVEAASWHQKFMVFDGSVAFVSGMNTKGADWDTSDHLVYDPHRMDLGASESDREDVEARESDSDYGVRKDYGIRVEGPAVADVEEVFWTRWEHALDNDAMYAAEATRFSPVVPAPDVADGVLTQVVVTMPEPWAEMSISETHARAFLHAEELIYIEDQYFRSTDMNEVLVRRMTENPDLLLVVVTKPASDLDPAAQYTYVSDQTFRTLFPDRYLLLQLRAVDLVIDTDWWDTITFESRDMDVHAKMRIVDDAYLSVGSCNFNNRGYLLEGEMNVSVFDADWVRTSRQAILENLVGDEWADRIGGGAASDFAVLREAAAANQERWDWWDDNGSDLDADEAADEWARLRPSGFVYPLAIDGTYEFDIGPDLF